MCREQRQINILIRQYLVGHGLKSTAMTLSEEAAGQLPSQAAALSSELPSLVELWQGREEAAQAHQAAEVPPLTVVSVSTLGSALMLAYTP